MFSHELKYVASYSGSGYAERIKEFYYDYEKWV